MNDTTTVVAPTTMHTGPLGSTIHIIRADAGTVATLAAVDWNRYFRRVCLDPVRGLITLMAPSHPHEDLTRILDHVVDAAGSILTGAVQGLLSTRLRKQGEPPGTGMEPDCAFYVGGRAKDFLAALNEGKMAAATFIERTAPDLVVEVEMTNADEGKIERYAEMRVRELWRLPRTPRGFVGVPGGLPRSASRTRPSQARRLEVLEGLTPGDVCEAVEGVRSSLTYDERKEAVARIVHRRQRTSIRVREERAPYPAH